MELKKQHLRILEMAASNVDSLFLDIVNGQDKSITDTIEQAKEELALAYGKRSNTLTLIQGDELAVKYDALIYTIDLLSCLRRNITNLDRTSLVRTVIVKEELDKFLTEVNDLLSREDEEDIAIIEVKALTETSLAYNNKIRRVAKSFLSHDSESMLTVLLYLALKERNA